MRRLADFALRQLAGLMPGELHAADFAWLVSHGRHFALLELRRATMIANRVRLVAFLFAVLTPLWSFIDFALFPFPLWAALAVMRLFASAAFGLLVFYCRLARGMPDAYRALAILFAIPTFFYVVSHAVLCTYELHGLSGAVRAGYAFLPFVLLAGMSVFPLTAIETLFVASPILIAQALSGFLSGPLLDWPSFAGAFWLLTLITGVSTLAGMGQLAFLIVLVRQAVHDPLTGICSRLSGQELLELQFGIARRYNAPLSIAFLDLDHFKSINDLYGHEAGDGILVAAVEAIAGRLRRADILARWGGEEFIVIMPNTDMAQARLALARLCEGGFGTRPDGRAVTASIGVAERIGDRAPDWKTLVETADRRMYHAKRCGRDRVAFEDEAFAAA